MLSSSPRQGQVNARAIVVVLVLAWSCAEPGAPMGPTVFQSTDGGKLLEDVGELDDWSDTPNGQDAGPMGDGPNVLDGDPSLDEIGANEIAAQVDMSEFADEDWTTGSDDSLAVEKDGADAAGSPTCDVPEDCTPAFALGPCELATCVAHQCGLGELADNSPCGAVGAGPGVCVAGTCTPLPACDDGDPCTFDAYDSASAACISTLNGACKKPLCGKTDDCDDYNPCTKDSCDLPTGACSNFVLPNGSLCFDGAPCVGPGSCLLGMCAGLQLSCSDGDPCTLDRCEPKTGHCTIVDKPDGAACDDGVSCTGQDVCANHQCGGKVQICDDGDACTVDYCSRKAGACVFGLLPQCGAPCSEVSECDDGEPCTTDSCKSGHCAFAPATPAGCDDGDPCTIGDGCVSGVCSGLPTNCSDGAPCTLDGCDPQSGQCWHKAVSAVGCDDGNACTWLDECFAGVCEGVTFKKCSSKDYCMSATCEPSTGACVTTPLTGNWCSNGGACLAKSETCLQGKCMTTLKNCDDGDPCTLDGCTTAYKCTHTALAQCGAACASTADCPLPPACHVATCAAGSCGLTAIADGGLCNDGKVCTKADACNAGVCAGTPTACNDGNACTFDKCSKASGACVFAPAIDGKGCADGDECSISDSCAAGECIAGVKAVCDDGLACTVDTCSSTSGTCAFAPLAKGATCDDGNPCTLADSCTGTSCVGAELPCDDADACTVDACSPLGGGCKHTAVKNCLSACVKTADCGDDRPCTVDSCVGGTCAHANLLGATCTDGDLCTANDHCVVGVNGVGCRGDSVQCVDDDPCVATTCLPLTGGCQAVPATAFTPCDDGEACTTDEHCLNGQCLAGHLLDCDDGDGCTLDYCQIGIGTCFHYPLSKCDGGCVLDADCSTGNPCVATACIAGTCDITPLDGKACSTGAPCEVAAVCAGGGCTPLQPTRCNDGNSCTIDHCSDSDTVCTSTPIADGKGCNDGTACTVNDVCQKGMCVGAPSGCVDGTVCTADACGTGVGNCEFSQIPGCGTMCAQSSDCGAVPVCSAWQCKGGTCMLAAVDVGACSDGSACTTGDTCVGGQCVGTAVPCNDGNGCTLDACDPETGTCKFGTAPKGTPCDDGTKCTYADHCEAGACVAFSSPNGCDDKLPCTFDLCDPKTGYCQHVSVANCAATCKTSTACEDANLCTVDTCQAGVCTFSPLTGTSCVDGQPCLGYDTCANGTCVGGTIFVCDDGNGCTADTCDTGGSCNHVTLPNFATCSDDNACTLDDICWLKSCTAGPSETCDDGLPCTMNYCEYKTGGCKVALHPTCGLPCTATATCDDGSPCTVDSCLGGVCTWKSAFSGCTSPVPCSYGGSCTGGVCANFLVKVCDDGLACTDDICNPLIGGCEQLKSNTCGASCKSDSDCIEANPCTLETCTSGLCKVASSDGVACSDGNPCTLIDACAGGSCKGDVSPCDDGNPCTFDLCLPPGPSCSHLAVPGCPP